MYKDAERSVVEGLHPGLLIEGGDRNRIVWFQAMCTLCTNAFISILFLLRVLLLFKNASDNSVLKQWPLAKTQFEMRHEGKRGLLKQHSAPHCLGRPHIKMRSFRNFPLKSFQFLNCLLFGKWIASWLKKKKKETIKEGRGMGLGKSLRFFCKEAKTVRNVMVPNSSVLHGVTSQVVSTRGAC